MKKLCIAVLFPTLVTIVLLAGCGTVSSRTKGDAGPYHGFGYDMEKVGDASEWLEALDSAKAELRKRGFDSPSGYQPPESEHPDVAFDRCPEKEDRPDIYEYFGTYPNSDARLLLDAFVSGDIDYTLDMDKLALADMGAVRAAYGGTFGASVGIAIGVHADDCARAMEIRQRVFKIKV
jgi:uncharacterized protein YceK